MCAKITHFRRLLDCKETLWPCAGFLALRHSPSESSFGEIKVTLNSASLWDPQNGEFSTFASKKDVFVWIAQWKCIFSVPCSVYLWNATVLMTSKNLEKKVLLVYHRHFFQWVFHVEVVSIANSGPPYFLTFLWRIWNLLHTVLKRYSSSCTLSNLSFKSCLWLRNQFYRKLHSDFFSYCVSKSKNNQKILTRFLNPVVHFWNPFIIKRELCNIVEKLIFSSHYSQAFFYVQFSSHL